MWVEDILVQIKRSKWAWPSHVTEWLPRGGEQSKGKRRVQCRNDTKAQLKGL